MRYKNAKLAAYMLVGVVALSGSSIRAEATGVSALLPAAGLALTLEEGSAQEEVKASTKSASTSSEDEKKETIVTSLKKETVESASKDSTKEDGTKEEGTKKESSAKDDSVKESTDKESSAKESTEKTKADSSDKENSDKKIEIKNTPETKEDKEKKEEKEQKKLIIEEDAAEKETVENSDEAKDSEEENLTEEEKEFSKLVIAKVNDYVNVRSAASEDSEIVGKLYDKSVGDFIQERNGWYRITSGNVTGFVKAEYCVTGEEAIELAKKVGTRVATVTTTTLKVRESAGTDAPVLGLVPIEEELSVIEELDGWVKVDIEEGYGYVSSEYVSLRTDFVKAESREEEKARLKKEEDAKKAAREAARKAEEKIARERAEREATSQAAGATEAPAPVISGNSSLGQAVVDYAMQFVGNPYVYGGTSLTNGADCSGFVMSVYKNFGVSLPHSSYADRKQGYDVGGLANAQPGDLVCYSGHVGIYAGNGKLVHASTSKTGIIVSNADYRKPLAVRRIF